MWDAIGSEVSPSPFGMLDPEEVLYEFDGPKLYVARQDCKPVLVYESATDDATQTARLIVAPTNDRVLAKLKQGDISIFEALDQPWLYAVDQSYDGQVIRAWFLSYGIESVPTNARPRPQTRLWPHLEQLRREQSTQAKKREFEEIVRDDSDVFLDLIRKSAKALVDSIANGPKQAIDSRAITEIDSEWSAVKQRSLSHATYMTAVKVTQFKSNDPLTAAEGQSLQHYLATLDLQTAQDTSIRVPADFSSIAWRNRVL